MRFTAIKRLLIALAVLAFSAWAACATSTQFNVVTQVKGILAVANGGTGVTTSTGGGANVLGTSPAFTTSANLSNNNIVTTPTDGFLIQNTTAATSGVPVQYSPNLHWKGSAWNTGGTPANNSTDWIIYQAPVSGSTPYTQLQFYSSINGGAYANRATLNSFGEFSTGAILGLSKIQIEGVKFTASGCTNGTTVGGTIAGSFKTGAAGACTITITMGSSQTAKNGWVCYANDLTTAAGNPIHQTSASTTTTAVLVSTASTASGDVINFGCLAY